MEFLVANRHLILEQKVHHQIKEDFVLISISSPELGEYKVPECDNMKDAHYAIFHDIDQDGNVKGAIAPVDYNNLIPFDDEMAKGIIDFALKWKDKVNLIVVHCDAGLSRSPGTALALSEVLNEDARMPQMFVRSLTGGMSLFNRFVKSKLIAVFYQMTMIGIHHIK